MASKDEKKQQLKQYLLEKRTGIIQALNEGDTERAREMLDEFHTPQKAKYATWILSGIDHPTAKRWQEGFEVSYLSDHTSTVKTDDVVRKTKSSLGSWIKDRIPTSAEDNETDGGPSKIRPWLGGFIGIILTFTTWFVLNYSGVLGRIEGTTINEGFLQTLALLAAFIGILGLIIGIAPGLGVRFMGRGQEKEALAMIGGTCGAINMIWFVMISSRLPFSIDSIPSLICSLNIVFIGTSAFFAGVLASLTKREMLIGILKTLILPFKLLISLIGSFILPEAQRQAMENREQKRAARELEVTKRIYRQQGYPE